MSVCLDAGKREASVTTYTVAGTPSSRDLGTVQCVNVRCWATINMYAHYAIEKLSCEHLRLLILDIIFRNEVLKNLLNSLCSSEYILNLTINLD